MPKGKAAPTAEAEVKGQEQEQEAQEAEVASSAEAEAQEQRGEETPDPLTGFTAEQLREHSLYKEASTDLIPRTQAEEERSAAYRDGQSAGAKQADAQTKEYVANKDATDTFNRLEQKRLSANPDDQQEFAQAMGDPKQKAAYDRGEKLRRGPSIEDIQLGIGATIIGGVNAELDERLGKYGALSGDESARIDPGKFKTLPELAAAKIDLLIERGVAAGHIADDDQRIKDSKEEGRRDAYDEMGLKYPAEGIEGQKPKPRTGADQLRKQYADGDIETEEYTRKMQAVGAKP